MSIKYIDKNKEIVDFTLKNVENSLYYIENNKLIVVNPVNKNMNLFRYKVLNEGRVLNNGSGKVLKLNNRCLEWLKIGNRGISERRLNKKLNKYPDYKFIIKQNKRIEQLKREGFIFIPKKKKVLLGVIFISTGLITFFIPFTTLPLILIGCLFLKIDKYSLFEEIKRRIKNKIRSNFL